MTEGEGASPVDVQTPTPSPLTVRDQIAVTMRDLLTLFDRDRLTPRLVDWTVDWAQKLTLRDLCVEYAMRAQELYAEADGITPGVHPVARAYIDSCRMRADALLQASAMIHDTVESRWPHIPPTPVVAPRNRDAG